MTAELKDLPDELFGPVRFVMIDGFSHEDAGLLCGVSDATIKRRLDRVAELFAADGAVKPERRKGEKRHRGGKGH
jgi:DNA-directed RNA polymerase specialized sigma24 family protein